MSVNTQHQRRSMYLRSRKTVRCITNISHANVPSGQTPLAELNNTAWYKVAPVRYLEMPESWLFPCLRRCVDQSNLAWKLKKKEFDPPAERRKGFDNEERMFRS